MRVCSCTAEISFCAKLNENTRRKIQNFDKYYNQNLEGRIDFAIKNSPLSAFYDDKATISFVETENPHCNIAPVVSIEINGIIATHVLKGSSSVCSEQDEEFLFDKMNRHPHRYLNTIANRLNSESPSEIKKSLALDYMKKIGIDTDSTSIDEKILDFLC